MAWITVGPTKRGVRPIMRVPDEGIPRGVAIRAKTTAAELREALARWPEPPRQLPAVGGAMIGQPCKADPDRTVAARELDAFPTVERFER